MSNQNRNLNDAELQILMDSLRLNQQYRRDRERLKQINSQPPAPHVKPDHPNVQLRDYFAAEAMKMLILIKLSDGASYVGMSVSKTAYGIADTMMRDRENNKS